MCSVFSKRIIGRRVLCFSINVVLFLSLFVSLFISVLFKLYYLCGRKRVHEIQLLLIKSLLVKIRKNRRSSKFGNSKIKIQTIPYYHIMSNTKVKVFVDKNPLWTNFFFYKEETGKFFLFFSIDVIPPI